MFFLTPSFFCGYSYNLEGDLDTFDDNALYPLCSW